jgi:hypothetical protein
MRYDAPPVHHGMFSLGPPLELVAAAATLGAGSVAHCRATC